MKKPQPTEYPYNPQTWKKKYECKKGKGDHKWVVVWAIPPDQTWTERWLEYKECTVCGKEKMDF